MRTALLSYSLIYKSVRMLYKSIQIFGNNIFNNPDIYNIIPVAETFKYLKISPLLLDNRKVYKPFPKIEVILLKAIKPPENISHIPTHYNL